MIETLHISNYALIDRIDIAFAPGFNVITGETGAGKSIILGALAMLLGGRADTKAVRQSDAKSVIEATFRVTGYEAPAAFCRQNDIEWDTDECILRREILPSGRSRAFINDTPVTLTILQSVATMLVDLHSQHQNLLLASPPYQLQVIDSIAANATERAEYTLLYNEYRAALHRYKVAKREIANGRADEEYNRFQLTRLQELNLIAGEQEELERDRELMANLTQVTDALKDVTEAMSEGTPSVLSLLKIVENRAAELTDFIEDAPQLLERIEALRIEAQDIADTYSAVSRDINADPARLQEIEERLNDIYDLERKHKVDSVEQLIAIRDNLAASLLNIENSDDYLHQLEDTARRAKKAALEAARRISARRQEVAAQFAETLKERALPLGMKNLRCQIVVSQGELTPDGIDTVEFLFAFNKNQPLMPVGGTASGGEISRLMLSLKSIIADKMQLPSIIFDEVDTGVSGDIAARMGRMMKSIAENIQVIAITHLPQVAAMASTQFRVYKEDSETSTNTRITVLTPEQRIEQIATMLSGDKVDEAARQNARSLLNPQN
ncbi:MAG: DNA repair protein RecN [Muribaculaceae bacterium]|nr:DNA repair protein RecN [Muribaculaceae bacterium]